jgi:phosphomannomutase
MAISLHVFREYDIRGLVATELTPEFAGQLGRGFGQYLLEKNHNHGSDNPASVTLGGASRSWSERFASKSLGRRPLTLAGAHT